MRIKLKVYPIQLQLGKKTLKEPLNESQRFRTNDTKQHAIYKKKGRIFIPPFP